MVITKDCISSPLEAGPSFLDSMKLPAQLDQALDYVSGRLMRKHIHLTLIVVRKELPPAPISFSPKSRTPPQSPSRPSLSKIHLPSLPGSPRSIKSSASCSSLTSAPTSPIPLLNRRNMAPQEPDIYGLSLHHTSALPPKTSQYFEETITKACKKYSLGSGWLSPPSSASASSTSASGLTLTSDLIRRSIQQHDVIYSSESLILLAVDRIFTFKLALSDYSRTFIPAPQYNPLCREERLKQRNQAKIRAVDELRLLVLFQKNRPISQSYLLRSYDHLSVSAPALRSVNEAYKAFFHADGIDVEAAKPLLPSSQPLESPSGIRTGSETVRDMTMKSGMYTVDMGSYYQAPATQTSCGEVMPITRNEWNSLMRGRPNVGRVEIY